KEKRQELKRLENISRDHGQSQLFIETPYRNNKLIEELCSTLSPATRLCIACDITLASEFIVTKPISVWKTKQPDIHKRPALFIIQA
ncbi:MAG: SAM-dependent methyltransferase, partial [Leeuwenhoekiella sp.]|nr:SAM-dependent methyltransferase [Leeuwenhoekiella sp.]